MAADASSVWCVIGGGDKGGIIVRDGSSTDSAPLPERLATCSFVRELALSGRRLRYERLTGSGPASGWISTAVPQEHGAPRELAVRAGLLWQVVGGGASGGIVVREGKETGSPLLPERLGTGAWVRELALQDGRLHFERVSGAGPLSGWVSCQLSDGKALVTKVLGELGAPRVAGVRPASGRKVRVVALHGLAHNSSVMDFQTRALRRELGDIDTEWIFLDAPKVWEPVPGSTDPAEQDISEFEKRLAGNKPLRQWFDASESGGSGGVWDGAWESCGYLRERLSEMPPVDVMLAFSNGSCIVTCLIGALMREGAEVPWRLNVFFHGGHVMSWEHDLEGPSTVPTIKITSKGADAYFADGEPPLKRWYSTLTELTHEDGHRFPHTQPRAREIYAQVTDEIRRHCGLR